MYVVRYVFVLVAVPGHHKTSNKQLALSPVSAPKARPIEATDSAKHFAGVHNRRDRT